MAEQLCRAPSLRRNTLLRDDIFRLNFPFKLQQYLVNSQVNILYSRENFTDSMEIHVVHHINF